MTLIFERAGKRLHTVELLDEPRNDAFSGAHVFEPSKLTATPVEVGDVLQYWAEARDSRAPTANHVQTVKYRLKIVEKVDDTRSRSATRRRKKESRRSRGRQQAARGRSAPARREQPRRSSEPEIPLTRPSIPRVRRKLGNERPSRIARNATRPDPEADTAAAMEKILEHQQQKDQAAAGPRAAERGEKVARGAARLGEETRAGRRRRRIRRRRKQVGPEGWRPGQVRFEVVTKVG